MYLSRQGAELMAKYGVRVPPGIACTTTQEVAAAAAKMNGDSGEVVVKSQVRGTDEPSLLPLSSPLPSAPHSPKLTSLAITVHLWRLQLRCTFIRLYLEI